MPTRNLRRSACLAAVCLVAVAVLFHAPLLRRAASVLVRDEAARDCTHLVVLGGDGRFQVAAEGYRKGQWRQILLLESRKSLLVEHGVIPAGHEIDRGQLLAHGLPAASITVLPRQSDDRRQSACLLQDWLAEHAAARVAVVTDRFASRHVACALRATMRAEDWNRVRIQGLRHRRYDESDWWQTRGGIKAFVSAHLSLLHFHVFGQPAGRDDGTWDPDLYGRELVASVDNRQ